MCVKKTSNFLYLFLFISLYASCIALAQEDEETDFIFADFQLDNRKTGIELDLATRDYENYYLSISLFNEQFVTELSCDTNGEKDFNALVGKFWEEDINIPISEQEQLFFIEEDECYLSISLIEQLNIQMRFDPHRQIFAVLTDGRHPKTKSLK